EAGCRDAGLYGRGLMPAAIHPINPDTSAMELMVASWFAAGHEVLWIPIVEVGDGKAAIAQARAEADALGKPYLLESIAELARLPNGVKGWLFPAHLDDTIVVAMRNGGDVIFGALRHPVTGQTISYRTDTESAIPGIRSAV